MGTNHQIADKIIFFDGICNLCNASVQFVIKRDKCEYFKFSSLQSEFAKRSLPIQLIKEDELGSIVLFMDGKLYTKSAAALRVARLLNGVWPLLYLFIIIPRPIRDWGYDWIAKNRYRWFGKRDTCMMPLPDQKSRFIE